MSWLSCQNLTLGYEGKMVVSDLSFTVDEGNYLCIVGENGSGKSTLVKALTGLKAPMSGRIETTGTPEASQIGYLPQQTAIQKDFPASVREVVRSGCLNRSGLRPFYRKEEKQLAEANMIKLGIASLAGRCYRELSGGQQQKVLLARALCATQKMLLLDEPVAGLDPRAAAEMYLLIERLNKNGTTVIMVSHDVGAAINYASHILHIGDHSVRFFGTKAMYRESAIGRLYIGREGEEQ